VFTRIGHVMLIIALLGASGAHWAVLQSVAWAAMLADNARTDFPQAAIEKTFDGKHPCALCKQIAKARQTERKPEAQSELKGLEFVQPRVAVSVHSPSDFLLLAARASAAAQLLMQSPPVPPPRTLPG
jgi:hypothetical protein